MDKTCKVKRYATMKRVVCLMISLLILCSTVFADTNTLAATKFTEPKKGSGFSGLAYQDWCQKMSKYSQVQKGGCRITTYTKLLHEAGYTVLANPDKFYEWGINKTFESNGKKMTYYTSSSVNENGGFGGPLIAAVKEQGGTAKCIQKVEILNMEKSKINTKIMDAIKAGNYCILSCGDHTIYVGRKESLEAGTAVLLDSSYSSKWSGTYGNIVKYTSYSANKFKWLRVYQVSDPVKKNTVLKITLDPQNNGSKQYLYEKYGVGIYSNSSCKTKATSVSVPKKSGYTFGGYYTQKDGKGTQYVNASGKISLGNKSVTKATTLYAYWKKNVDATKPKIDVTSAPSTLVKGKSFGLRGTIKSNVKITRVDAYIINASGKTVQSKYDTPNAKTFDIKDGKINKDLKFGSLSAGTYTLKITAKNSAGTSTYTKEFTVAGKPTIDVTSAPSSIAKGSSFGLRGTIKANAKITRVDAYIINASGKTVQSKYDTPNAKSFDIKNGKINKDLKFGSLSEGKYTLKITAKNSAGTATYTKEFTVVGKPKISVTSAPDSIKKGKSFGLRGTIKASSKITRVDAYIINASGKTVQSKYDTPNAKSFDIKNGKINKELKFGKLAKGTYTLKITAKNNAGTTTYTKKFTVK